MTHEEKITQAWQDLQTALPRTIHEEGRTLIESAYNLAKEAHKYQTRKSGEPYLLHPIAVARIVVTEMRQKDAAIAEKDAVIDADRKRIAELEKELARYKEYYGKVAAVTKPNKEQVDNFKHILSSVHGDVRVLILKLSDRLHNMRTLESMKPQKQWKIASETQFFFAPLAGRLGLYRVKSELENLAFQFLNPQEYARIEKLLEEDKARTRQAAESFMNDCLHKVGEVFGGAVGWDIRYRRPYSVWREMQELGCDFYHVPFKHYLRACYDMEDVADETGWSNWDFTEEQVALTIYSTLVSIYREQTGSFVNYMAQPKANGYRSIHFRLLNPYGSIEEFHVASDDMREQSNWGCIVESKEQWMKRLTAVLEELSKDQDTLMPGIHDSLFNEDIVVYTPKVKAITLPKGATALDFAYEVHTDIGNHARCARINDHLASIRTALHRGDSVEIITSADIHPLPDWMDAVITYKAKKQIRNALKADVRHPDFMRCPHCHPLPESKDLIGFHDREGMVVIHQRNCPDAIRCACEQGHSIVAVEFHAAPEDLYPVRLCFTAIDRYHLLQDVMACIVEDVHLSMNRLNTATKDNIVSCTIDFSVHSATEKEAVIAKVSAIQGVEELNTVAL